MKYIALLAILLLSACASKPVPVKIEFPNPAPSLLKKCDDLLLVETKPEGTSALDLLKTVTKNYTMYYQCANKVDGWNTWYDQMQKIYNGVGE